MKQESENPCSDYRLGPFAPISFEPKLQWEITRDRPLASLPIEKFGPALVFKAPIGTAHFLTVWREPASGEFAADGYEFGFGGKYSWLGTKDPEEALYLTELKLVRWARKKVDNYQYILSLVE